MAGVESRKPRRRPACRRKLQPRMAGKRAEPVAGTSQGETSTVRDVGLLESTLSRDNLIAALKRGKASGGAPGIDVLDRFIQQAVAQVLTPIFDPTFSESSFGFHPGRKAHDDAVKQIQGYAQAGTRGW